MPFKTKTKSTATATAVPVPAAPAEQTAAEELQQGGQPAAAGTAAKRKASQPAEAPAAADEQLALPTSTAVSVLPDLDAPCVNANEPALSYKIDFRDKDSWHVSCDGGKTKERIDNSVIAGMPLDLALQISKAKERDGEFDQRLRLAFQQPVLEGEAALAELNINAINRDRDGNLYVTSSARSLVGALLAISDSEDDMHAFMAGARFRLRPGRGKGVFVEVDIAAGDRWVAMASPAATNRVAKDAAGFHSQLAMIKSRFRSCGLMLTSAAVLGEIEAYDSEESDQFVEVAAMPLD